MMSAVKYVLLICAILWSATGYSADRYVTTNGPSTSPYTNWAQAASNIQTAVNAASAGETIWVSNGLYRVSSRIDVGKGVIIKSVNGYQVTIVDGNKPATSNLCMRITHSNAVIDGFTLTNGTSTGGNRGGCLDMTAGTVQNCLLTGGGGPGTSAGGGAALEGSVADGICTLKNCIIRNNIGGYGVGGVYCNNGRVINCLITENYGSGGAEECIGGIRIANLNDYGGYLIGCTIVSNKGGGGGSSTYGGMYIAGTNNANSVLNCVIYGNSGRDIQDSAWPTNINAIAYSCIATNIFTGPGIVTNAPQFMDTNTANYRLTRSSPCLNTGTNQAWMNGTSDLDGRSRIDRFSDKVDMGCYEYLPSGVMFRIK